MRDGVPWPEVVVLEVGGKVGFKQNQGHRIPGIDWARAGDWGRSHLNKLTFVWQGQLVYVML